MKKKFIALLVTFTSAISFLPVGFNGQAAKAATTGVSLSDTTIQVSCNGSVLTPRRDANFDFDIYTKADAANNKYSVTIKDSREKTDINQAKIAIEQKAKGSGTTAGSYTGIIDESIEIVAVNGLKLANPTDAATLSNYFGVTIDDVGYDSSSTEQRIGKVVGNLPLGINKITYKINITTATCDYTPAITTTVGNTTTTTPATSNLEGNTTYHHHLAIQGALLHLV